VSMMGGERLMAAHAGAFGGLFRRSCCRVTKTSKEAN
jgi:hypothetical protein